MKKSLGNKLISIVLPTYNGEQYIAEALKSIISQTYQTWELIIIDDCSTDNTNAIIHSLADKDPRIQVHRNERNMKLPASLNIGFSFAKGEYYTWTSDDNILLPDMLARLTRELDEDHSCGAVYSNMKIIDENGAIVQERIQPEPDALPLGNVVGASFLYRADVSKKVGAYDASLFCAEDYDFWLRLAAVSKLKRIDDFLYLYRIHPGGLSATKKDLVHLQTYRTLLKNFDLILPKLYTARLRYTFCKNLIIHAPNEKKRLLKKILNYTWLKIEYAPYKLKDISVRAKNKIFH